MAKKHIIKLESRAKIIDSVVGLLRSYFSIQHIQSAVYFADEAKKIERQGTENITDEVMTKHRAYVTASIFATIAFLEANINEIFCDAYEMVTGKSTKDGKFIPVQLIDKLGRMWQLDVPRSASFSILQKYQIALSLADKLMFEKGKNHYQDINLFIKVRNALIHYEPESVVISSTDARTPVAEQKFEKMLQSKFELNPLTGKSNSFFPDKCLSYGCCKWGIASSLAFTDEFCRRMDIKSKYLNIHQKLLLD